jgi:hypothetical protein
MSKINLSGPRFSSNRKSRLVNLRIFETKSHYSIYIWNKNYDIYGFQFYILNSEIESCSSGDGVCKQFQFSTSFMSNGFVYGVGKQVTTGKVKQYSILPKHSTIDDTDGINSKFTLLTQIDKKNIKIKEGKRKLCITDAKILIKSKNGSLVKIQAHGDCNIIGVDNETPLKSPKISKERMLSAYNKRKGNS